MKFNLELILTVVLLVTTSLNTIQYVNQTNQYNELMNNIEDITLIEITK